MQIGNLNWKDQPIECKLMQEIGGAAETQYRIKAETFIQGLDKNHFELSISYTATQNENA